MATKPAAKPQETKEAPAARGGKGLLIGVVAALLLAGGAGAGWYLTRPAAAEAARAAPKPVESIFMSLDPFTVNLADEGGERLAQVGIVLELAGKEAQLQLTRNLPIVRNNTLLLLSSQHAKTLLSLDGKLALASQIAARTAAALGWKEDAADAARAPNPVVAVHFSQMLVQ
jgi:flagellar FliL protein